MPTLVVIPQPVRGDIDEADDPHIFTEVTTEPFDVPYWNDAGELEVYFPTVDLNADQMNEVIRIARDQPMLFDPDGPEFPPPLIPGVDEIDEGLLWTGFARIESLLAGRLQVDMSVAGRIYVFQYADPEDPDSGIAEHSALIEISYDDGFTVWTPVMGPDGQWLYHHDDPDDPTSPLVQVRHRTVSFPVAAWEQEDPDDPGSAWHQVAAAFNGEVEASHLTVDGRFDLNGTQTVGVGSEVVLANAVTNPTESPTVTYAEKQQNWPNSRGFTEIGMGHHNGRLVQGRIDVDNNGVQHVTARFIDPATGFVQNSVELTIGFYVVGGFTCTGGFIYVLNRFSRLSDPYSIHRFNMNGVYTGHVRNVNFLQGGGYNTGGLGDVNRDDCVGYAYRDANDHLKLNYYTLDLSEWHLPATETNYATTRAVKGVPERGFVAAGNKFFDIHQHAYHAATSWTTDANHEMSGAGFWGGEFVHTDGTGVLFRHNSEVTTDFTPYFSWTKTNTTTGAETTQSPYETRRWPARKWATVQTPPIGAAEYDDVHVYAGTSGTRGTQYRVPKEDGPQAIVSSIPTSGANPPATSTFGLGTPSKLRTQGLIPGTSRPAGMIDASGNAELYGLKTIIHSREHSLGQWIPHNGGPINWDTAYDTDPDIVYLGYESGFQLALAGIYRIGAQITFTQNGTGYRAIYVGRNGQGAIQGARLPSGSSTQEVSVGLNRTLRCAAGDRLLVSAWQNTGSGLQLMAAPNNNWIEIVRLGA